MGNCILDKKEICHLQLVGGCSLFSSAWRLRHTDSDGGAGDCALRAPAPHVPSDGLRRGVRTVPVSSAQPHPLTLCLIKVHVKDKSNDKHIFFVISTFLPINVFPSN